MQGAAPVHLLAAPGQQVLWLVFIALKVPLLLDCLGMQGCQGVAVTGLVARTNGTSLLLGYSVQHCGLPGVLVAALTVLAQPPHFAVGATRDDCGGAVTIFGGVPLRCQVRMALSQGGLPCAPQPPSSPVRCSCTLPSTWAAHKDGMHGGEEVGRSLVR